MSFQYMDVGGPLATQDLENNPAFTLCSIEMNRWAVTIRKSLPADGFFGSPLANPSSTCSSGKRTRASAGTCAGKGGRHPSRSSSERTSLSALAINDSQETRRVDP